MLKSVVCSVFLIFSGAAVAQETSSFNCEVAQSSAEKLICDNADLAQLDRLLATRYASALSVVKKLGSGAKETEQELKAYQRGWVKGRDDCWKSDNQKDCIILSYQKREAELVAQYILEKPITEATWHCEGSPANELVTYFFDTELPSVRIERGGRVSVGGLSRTASGSRYDANFGEFIWTKGDEALYRAPDPDGSELSCVIADQ